MKRVTRTRPYRRARVAAGAAFDRGMALVREALASTAPPMTDAEVAAESERLRVESQKARQGQLTLRGAR